MLVPLGSQSWKSTVSARPRILVIVPGSDLRRSLAFSLETEGCIVTSRSAIPSANPGRGYDAVVLDHSAARGDRDPVLALCRNARVILLAGTPQPWLLGCVRSVVQTPILGHALTRALRKLVTSVATK
jgi:hypothetical protein